MPSISSILSDNIEGILGEFEYNTGALAKIAPDLRARLIDEGLIVKYPKQSINDKTVVAIDGGNIKEDMSGGDLIIVGATAGEGHSTVPLYTEESVPAEAFGAVMPHRVANQKLGESIRAALELRLLETTKQADIQIIDGALINNASQMVYTILENDDIIIDEFFKAINYDEDNKLRDAMQRIFYPPRDNTTNIIALPKSDTARQYVKDYIKDNEFLQERVSDRILATRMLEPGEMFIPRNIASNPSLIQKLERKTYRTYSGDSQALYYSLLDMKLEYLRRLNDPSLGGSASTEEGILWTTYFKPHLGTPHSKAMKIEFAYYRSIAEGGTEGMVKHAQKLVGNVDADMVDGFIIEPWCQYMADVRAKDVSAAKDIIRGYLISTIDNPHDLYGLLRNYRT